MAVFYENIAKGMKDKEDARTPLPGNNLKVQQETQQPLTTKRPETDITGAPYQVRYRQVDPIHGGFGHLFPLSDGPSVDVNFWQNYDSTKDGGVMALTRVTREPRPERLPSEIASEGKWIGWRLDEFFKTLSKEQDKKNRDRKKLLPSQIAKLTQKKEAESKKSNGGETAEATPKNANEKAFNFTGETLSGFMQSKGMDFSYNNREKLAKRLGIDNYKGTAKQNIQMLKLLKSEAATQTPQTRPNANLVVQDIVDRNMPQITAPKEGPQNTWTPEQVLSGNGPQSGAPSQEEVNNMMALLVDRFKKGGSLDPAHAIQKSPLKHPDLPEELKLGALKCGGSMAKSKKPRLKPKKK